MTSRLDQALDDVIKDRSERSGSGRRHNNNSSSSSNRNSGSRNDFTRRRQVDNNGVIRKRLGPSKTIQSFVRTVNVQNSRGSRDVNSQWAHDMFDDDRISGGASIISRLGVQRSGSSNNSDNNNRTSDISIENLHYDVTEKDLEELFSTVADVVKAKLMFDPSGRSTGVAVVKYNNLSDAEKAVKKYNNVELDGQAMKIELKEYTPRQPRSGGRFNSNRLDSRRSNDRRNNDRGNRSNRDRDGGRDGGRERRSRDNRDNDRKKQTMTAEDLDKEMDNYMKSNASTNEDTDMILD